MSLDPQYLEAIKGFEGYVPQATWDHKQYSSGYGTKAEPGEVIDRATAEQRFQEAIQKAAAHVDSVNPNLPDGARAALISLTYNAGPGWAQSGLGEMVRKGDLQGAQERFIQYNKASGEVNPGLVKRRAAEVAWFGNQPAQAPAPQAAPASPASPAMAIPAQPMPLLPPPMPLAAPGMPVFAPSVPPQAAPQQQQAQAQQAPADFFSQMPAEMAAPPPIFAKPRKPIDISRLRAALAASGNRGFFNARG